MSDNNQPSDPAMPSTWDDTRITAYVMNELSADERSSFEQQIAGDAILRQAVADAERIKQQLGAWFASETPGMLDGERRKQILAATGVAAVSQPAESYTTPSIDPFGSRSRLIPWLLAAAASLAVAIGILPSLKQPTVAIHQDAFDQTLERNNAEDAEPDAVQDGALQLKEQAIVSSAFGSAPNPTAANPTAARTSAPLPVEPATAPVSASSESVQAAGKPLDDGATFQLGQRGIAMQSNTAPGQQDESLMQVEARSDRQRVELPESLEADFAPPPPQPMRELDEEEDFALDTKSMGEKSGAAAPVNEPASPELLDRSTHFRTSEDSAKVALRPESERGAAQRPVAMQGPDAGLDAGLGAGLSVSRRLATSLESGTMLLDGTTRLDLEFSAVPADSSRFAPIIENSFQAVADQPLSTFSIDVDTASYSKVRRTLMEGRLPTADAVRIEELINYFEYQYDAPAADSDHPFVTEMTIASCPWNADHRLARVAIQGKTLDRASRPPCNLVFLLDTSGSMNQPNKLPLVIEGMKMLTQQLSERDRVAIVVYAGSAGLVLESTPANKQKRITKALAELSAGGSTNGADGIRLAYATARDHFIHEGVNRVILCTDGDFNVGLSGTDELVELVKDEASGGIFLTALGFGMDNHNDAMMEQISGKGNGNYAFIDTANEACKVLVHQTNATLVTIAKDVKLQIEFNGRLVSQYRLIGYENRVMAKEDFNNDKKDAGEIGAGHQVTALYELVLADHKDSADEGVDPLKYQQPSTPTAAAASDEVMTVKLRYKKPDGDESTLVQFTAKDDELAFANADPDFRFAASVASFGMLLRNSAHSGTWTLRNVLDVAKESVAVDEYRLRAEFVQLVAQAIQLSGR